MRVSRAAACLLVVCLVAGGPLLVAGGLVMLVTGGGGGGRGGGAGGALVCDTGGASLSATDADGAAVDLDATQVSNAALVVGSGSSMGRQAQVVAVVTALQESGLRNLANDGSFSYPAGSGVMSEAEWESARAAVVESMNLPHDGVGSDWDSIGLFQQRPSAGWGSVGEIMDPATSAATFYSRLSGVAGWESMSAAEAAQKVQVSQFPDAYARWEPVAQSVVSALSGVSCRGGEEQGGGGPVTGATGDRGAVVTFALQQVGEAYVWGAEGPDAWDCSGLVQGAYAQAGVTLEHSSGSQGRAGVEVSAADARPGDILWWPGHVAIYIGDGEMVGAQSEGEGVRRMAVYGAPVYRRVLDG